MKSSQYVTGDITQKLILAF